ncbi:MAG: LPS export ABC transporter periplasmic protein LptC [Candidatus Omnitrophota bacterium]|nr:MAG: LPS export ABC transporter periplasmic protein LptC [Candidatus Omnitrophota bacterium]
MTNPENIKKMLITIFVLPIAVLGIVLLCIGIINRSKSKEVIIRRGLESIQSSRASSGAENLDVGNFSFTEYAKISSRAEKSYILSGERLQTKSPKFGIFRINVGKVMEVEKPKISFYKNNLAVSTACARTAVVNSLSKGVELYGNATLTTEDKRVLTCNELKWNNQDKTLLAEGNCIIRTPNEIIEAEEITTDIELKNFNVISKDKRWLKIAQEAFSMGMGEEK